MPLPAWKAGDPVPLCRVPWEEQGVSGFPGRSKQTPCPGKWDLAVKDGLAPHLRALPNTPILYETNLLRPRAGPSAWDVPRTGLFLLSRQALPAVLGIPEG